MNKELEEAIKRLTDKIENDKKYINSTFGDLIEEIINDNKAIQTVLNYIDNSISKEEYNKIKEENEILKQEKRSRIIGKYGEIEVHDLIKQTLSKDFISKEVIKEKKEKATEEYKYILDNIDKKTSHMKDEHKIRGTYAEFGVKRGKLEALQELLEGK